MKSRLPVDPVAGAVDEFDLIEQYFRPLGGTYRAAELGIGDDAAILNIASNEQLLVTTDTQIESVHFPADADASLIAYRSCAASISDIAAMGGTARWATLAISVPKKDPLWLEAFSAGAGAALQLDDTALVGGDTTAGPLAVSWTIVGSAPSGTALRRDGAQVGDDIYVSGTLGAASAALNFLDHSAALNALQSSLVQSYWRPQPRLQLGRALRGTATSCIDISDGLLADLGHITRASNTGADLQVERLPIDEPLDALFGASRAREFALGGGDDYELCFSAPRTDQEQLSIIAESCGVEITRIGQMTSAQAVTVFDQNGDVINVDRAGYRHFK